MGSCVHWNTDDAYGDNPTGRAGEFEFMIWYEFDPDDLVYPTTLNLLDAKCTEVFFADEQKHRAPSDKEAEMLAPWCLSYLDSHPDDYRAVRNRAIEYSYLDPAEDDL